MAKLLFLGDFFFDYCYIPNDINKIAKFIEENDYKVILNLEGSLFRSNDIIKKRGPNLAQSLMCVEVLKSLNVIGVCLANNHIMDYGEEGLKKTIELLEKNNILYCGAGLNIKDAQKPMQLKYENKTISIFNSAWNIEEAVYASKKKAGCSPRVEKDILKFIERKDTDLVVNVLHWGFEYNTYPMPVDIEFAHKQIEHGADLVIGHHPHNIQSMEKYKGKFIFYSLGNFYFSSKREQFSNKKFHSEVSNLCDYGLGIVFDTNINDVSEKILFYYDKEKCETLISSDQIIKSNILSNLNDLNIKGKKYISLIKREKLKRNPILTNNFILNKIKLFVLDIEYKLYALYKKVKNNF